MSQGQDETLAVKGYTSNRGAAWPRIDEPTGNLDEGTRDEIISLLESLWRDRGLTMVLVTHDTPVARRAQRRGIIKDGQLSISNDARQVSP